MSSTKDIIEILKDDYQYYTGEGKNYLSNSDIANLLENPAAFGQSRPDNKSFAEGRYFHQLLIEPDKAKNVKFVETSSRLTKEYKNYCEANNLEFCLLKKEVDDIRNLSLAMMSNVCFYDEIFKDGNVYEQPGIMKIKGVMWKGKADIITDTHIIDLKTTNDINKFKYSAKSYNYDSQCYIYQQLFGKPLVFYVVDKNTSQIGMFHPSENFIKGGETKVERAVEVYNKFFGKNKTDDVNTYFINEQLD
jgi:hypothetical protein